MDKYTVPDGISIARVFMTLYKHARGSRLHPALPNAGKPPASEKNAMQMLSALCDRGLCGEVRGKLMNVDFRTFPRLDLASYNELYGKEAGQTYIAAELAHTDEMRTDAFNVSADYRYMPGWCEFLGPERLYFLADEDWSDMRTRVNQCRVMHKFMWHFRQNIKPHGERMCKKCNDYRVNFTIETRSFTRVFRNMSLLEAKKYIDACDDEYNKDAIVSCLHIHCKDKSCTGKYPFRAPALRITDANDFLHGIYAANKSLQILQ